MPYATTLYFDLETDAAVRRLWQAIDDAGLPSTMINLGYRPHLTLTVGETLDMDALRGLLPGLTASIDPIPVTFPHLGTFTVSDGVVFLGVTVTQMLIDIHKKVWGIFETHSSGNSNYYAPDLWVPHVTLGYSLTKEQVGQAVSVLLNSPLPTSGIATELVVTDVSPTGYVDLYASRLGTHLTE